MNAKAVVGPTNFQPRFFRSLDSMTEVGEVETVCGGSASTGPGS
jgi:hypothetical protein